ncbi:MAG TPA: RNA methyltransferase [Thiobacillaceae bacterium]|nr:RNA methyltransferase [Thiobacillaceae bacterium]
MQTETFITSRDNPLFKRLKQLADSARARRAEHLTLLDGVHLIEAYLEAGGQPSILMFAASCPAELRIILAGRCAHARLVSLADKLFGELSPVATPVGVLAEAAWLDPHAAGDNPLVLLLEDIQDPGNLGSLLRSAAAAGASLAVLSLSCADPWSPKALRGGQGAQFVLPLQQRTDLLDWMLRHPALPVVALSLQNSVPLYQLDLSGPVGILVGNEGAGLSSPVLDAARYRANIPMPGRTESLNVAAAAAVALFEAVRQRFT